MWKKLLSWLNQPTGPQHLATGKLGEKAALKQLKAKGYKPLVENYRGKHGEIDLVMRDGECLVFIEVKTRSSEEWTRPSRAVDQGKRMRLTKTALQYLREINRPKIAVRFDIVEVLVDGDAIREIRHLENAFPMEKGRRYDV